MTSLWPRRSVRLRLTLVYGVLFLVTGLGLLLITYLLVQRAVTAAGAPAISFKLSGSGGPAPFTPPSGTPTGTPIGPDFGVVVPVPTGPVGQPSETSELAQAIRLALDERAQQVLHELVRNSAIALGAMLLVAVALGWFVAGRNLRPLRNVTATVRQITHTNLHRRLAVTGPDDEFKELSDTFDELLDRLESSFEAQRRFVANASHELRTPLARQRVIAQVALADPDATVDSLREAHERVLAAGVEQERLIEALLALARGQHGSDTAVGCDLATIGRDVLDHVQPDAGVTVDAALHTAPLMGDPRLVEQLVTNLVDNAVRHNVPGGHVDVTTNVAGEQSVLVVANTGPEIPADAVDRLLEPFRRLGADRTRHDKGLGLGLSIVAAIAASHDAELHLAPRDGGGLVVTVRFPAAVAAG